MFDRLFGIRRQSRDVNKLIQEIADHNRSAAYAELFRRLPAIKLYFPVSQSAIQTLPKGKPVQVPKDSNLRLPNTVVKGRSFVVLYTSSSDNRLGEHYAEIQGAEALRMVMRIPDVDGLLIQAEGTAWVGIDKDKISHVLGTAA